MREYFDISYEKNKVLNLKRVNVDELIINMIELNKENYKIVIIKDEYGQYHSEDEIIEIYKESLDIEYEDVTTKTEAYNIAFEYYKKLYNNNYIEKEIYNKYILKLKEYKKEIKDKNQFINKIKDIQVRGV